MISVKDKQYIKSIGELLEAINTLPHVCNFTIVRGGCSDGVAVWKCECGKIIKKR